MSTQFYGANVHANGIRQHYLRFNEHPQANAKRDPVVIIPGITSPAVTWGFVGTQFGKYFDTYILDVRGRGLSEANDSLDYSVDAQAADVSEFLTALELNKASVVGHSMGARIAARMARNHRSPKRMVLIDPPVSGPERRPYPSNLSWYVDSIRAANDGVSHDDMRQYCPTWTDDQLRLRAEWLHTCNERAIRESFEAFHNENFHEDLTHVSCPTLLIAAEKGDVVLDQDVAEIESLLVGLRFERVPAAGHMIPWDNEQGFYEAFGDFLGSSLRSAQENNHGDK